MNSPVLAASGHAAIDLNQPGTYLHWNIFTVSLANLVLIAVMVAIFAAALLIPFPKGRTYPAEETGGMPPAGDGTASGPPGTQAASADQAAEDDTSDMWTARVRRRALALLPPAKLLPDRQPAYVASWVYVFGVASIVALGAAVISGFAIALGGTDWWHTNPVGHFFNSLHLWSVELFMAFIVIHLWAKFWMAAWRGRRALTWVTGVVAFMASVVECFTGYLSQQNFDSQWISTSAKDAFNSVGVGAFWNAMNFGQMLLWHVVLVPIALIAIVGAHVLLVRVRGVSHPLPAHLREPGATGSWRQRRRARREADAAPWRGRTRRYDILKEGAIASVIVLIATVALAAIASSPDVPPVTVQSWARVAPADFLATAATELNGTSETATFGPPYNNGTDGVQHLLGSPQQAAGVTMPIDAAQTFVISPLSKLSPSEPAVRAALATYQGASPAQQKAWADAYLKAVTKVTFVNGTPVVPPAADGPVPAMLASELTMARGGGVDADLLSQARFYGTDFTKPLLFLEDGEYFANKATAMHLSGEQWGVMNETGSYPGQPWLWLYTLWYQIPAFGNAANADMIAIYLTGLATILLLAVPFIPGLRDIPRLIPVHRLVWRDQDAEPAGAGSGPGGAAGHPGPGQPGDASTPAQGGMNGRDSAAGSGGSSGRGSHGAGGTTGTGGSADTAR